MSTGITITVPLDWADTPSEIIHKIGVGVKSHLKKLYGKNYIGSNFSSVCNYQASITITEKVKTKRRVKK